jgi:hypothetical protein
MDLCGNGVGAGFVHIKNFAACLGGFPTNMTGVVVPVDGGSSYSIYGGRFGL